MEPRRLKQTVLIFASYCIAARYLSNTDLECAALSVVAIVPSVKYANRLNKATPAGWRYNAPGIVDEPEYAVLNLDDP